MAPEDQLARPEAALDGAAEGAPSADLAEVLAVQGEALGTTWSVQVVHTGEQPPSEAGITQLVQAELALVDEQMSTWRPDSEISELNATQDTAPHEVSAEFFEVTSSAVQVYGASGGAFDITVRPLLRRWGFGSGGSTPETAPTEAELAELGAYLGSDKLVLDPEARTIAKADGRVELDLSAIAKGYAVDLVSQALAEAGHPDHLVEIGGEIQARGHNRKGQPWRLGVEKPDVSNPLARSVELVVPLQDQAMATSGDYRDYREVDGVRVSHTIDPRTGSPIRHGLASVTVLHESCMEADAWATALNVLGPEEGMAAAEREGLAVLMLVRQAEGGFAHQPSAAFTAHMQSHAPDAPR